MISKDMVWKVLRFEINESGFYQLKFDHSYALDIEPDRYVDVHVLTSGFEKLKTKEIKLSFFYRWISFFQTALETVENQDDFSDIKPDYVIVISDLEFIRQLEWDFEGLDDDEDVEDQIGILLKKFPDIERHLLNVGKPWNQKKYSQEEAFKIYFDLRVIKEDQLSDLDIQKIHFFLDDLVKQDYTDAIFELGRISYTGEFNYPQDYALALKCYLYAGEHGIQQGYANAGYIYYYDRLNTGQPDYEQAYRCFSQAAFAGNFNAIYKTSDMLKNGYWISKNEEAAYRMLLSVYRESRNLYVNDHDFSGCFPDISFRLGLLAREGKGTNMNEEEAMYLFLEARAALQEKVQNEMEFGDNRVLEAIERNVNEMNLILGYSGFDTSVLFDHELNNWIDYLKSLNKGHLKVKVMGVPNRTDKVTMSVSIKSEFFFTNNRLNYSGLTKTIQLGLNGVIIPENDVNLRFDATQMGIDYESKQLVIGKGKNPLLILSFNHVYLLKPDHPMGTDFSVVESAEMKN